MSLVVVDYGSGNLPSVAAGLARAGGRDIAVSNEPEQIRRADIVILPGVSAFAAAREGLEQRGLVPALEEAVFRRGAFFLGICAGMQILAAKGLEHGEQQGLGWLAGTVRPLRGGELAIPHMGWNAIHCRRSASPLLAGLDGADFYFAHSYVYGGAAAGVEQAHCVYGERFTAALAQENLYGVQFHPEKSAAAGERFFANFLQLARQRAPAKVKTG